MQILREKDSDIKLAKIDGTVEEETLKKMEVKGYPTLFFYRDGEPVKYSGKESHKPGPKDCAVTRDCMLHRSNHRNCQTEKDEKKGEKKS